MRLRHPLHIAARDAASTMRTATYAALFLSPLLLALLLAFLVLAASVMLSVLQALAPGEAPTGHGVAALVFPATFDKARRSQVDDILQHLREVAGHEPEEARLLRRFIRFVKGVSGAEQAEQRTGRTAALRVQPVRGTVETARSLVPKTYDAAIVLHPLDDVRVRYEIVSDRALLYSRTAGRLLGRAVDSYNGHQRLRQMTEGGRTVRVVDASTGRKRLWVVRTLLYGLMVGLALVYHSVGMQSVAGVLAGEREARTLDVLLSLPVTWREVMWGKILGIVGVTALPTLFWDLILGTLVRTLFQVTLHLGPVFLVILAVLTFLTSIGCAVSATSRTTTVARNRLGMVNLSLFFLASIALAAAAFLRPWAGRVALLWVREAASPTVPWIPALMASGILIAATLLVVEFGIRVARRF